MPFITHVQQSWDEFERVWKQGPGGPFVEITGPKNKYSNQNIKNESLGPS